MSFDIFENIFTASDPAGGRVIKVSTTAGIDNAESYYTISDPSGGRAIKVKLIGGGGGGGSTGTLQTLGGVPLSSSLVFITDSATPSANYSPLLMSTGSLEVRRTGTTGTYLFTVDGGGSDGYARINSGDGYTSVLEFSTGGSGLKIGDVRGDTTNGMAMTSSVAFPIKFYTNGDLVNQAIDLDTVGTLNAYFSITLKDLASAGNSKITFNYSNLDTQIGLISATESNFEVSSKNGRPLWLSTGGSPGALIVNDDGAVNIATNLSINGPSGTGYIYLASQVSNPAGATGKLSLWSDSSGRLNWRQGTGTATLAAGLNVAQTFTAAQTISTTAIGTGFSPFLTLVNTTSATNVLNQNSPAAVLQGNFWSSSSTSSRTGAFRLYVRQLNATAGVGGLGFFYSDNGAAEVESFRVSHNGAIFINNTAGFAANIGGPGSGGVRLTDGSGNSVANARLQFGEQTTASPMLRRGGTNLELRFGDDTYGAGFSVGSALAPSAILQADTTTKGFLPPRMTTAQKNAMVSTISITAISGNGTTITYTAANTLVAGNLVTITGATTAGYNLTNATVATATSTSFTVTNSATGATSTATGTYVPATGLVIFDTDLGKLCVRTAGGWQTITSA